MVRKPGKHQRSKQRCQDLGWKVQNLLFCAHALCMSYVTNTFLLVSFSVLSNQLMCFVQGQGQKSEQKPTTKNFVGFHNHSPLLTMDRKGRNQDTGINSQSIPLWSSSEKSVRLVLLALDKCDYNKTAAG